MLIGLKARLSFKQKAQLRVRSRAFAKPFLEDLRFYNLISSSLADKK